MLGFLEIRVVEESLENCVDLRIEIDLAANWADYCGASGHC
jgi:hypothetical protein